MAYDLTLQHPRCVFQLLKQQYSRYTPEMVERITGIPKDQLLKAVDLFTSVRKDGDMKKVATIIYAVGWTQHYFRHADHPHRGDDSAPAGQRGTSGRRRERAARPLEHSGRHGSWPGIFDILPGYLKMPNPNDTDFATYLKRTTPTSSKPHAVGFVQLLVEHSEIFGVAPESDVSATRPQSRTTWHSTICPKIDRNYSWTQIWDEMYRGNVKGMFAFGMNGVMIGPDTQKNIDALKKADWLVVGEIYPDETSEFWRAPGTTTDDMKKINTTVYRLPCAGFAEKDGSMTNSARWLQWKNAAVPPPGDARLDQDIMAQIFLRVRELYKKDGGKFPDPIAESARGPIPIRQHPSLAEVAKEINGKALADLKDDKTGQEIKAGQQLPGFAWLKDDGTTSCGNWLYCGSWTEAGRIVRRVAARKIRLDSGFIRTGHGRGR